MKKRCAWCESSDLYKKYHDEEWGVPVHDDRTLFEFLILEGAQAGLSWITVLNKRENYRKAFDNFNEKEYGSFDKYIWQFTDYKVVKNNFATLKEVPATTPQSDVMSKTLKKRGFKFVGSTICYAYMQAVGMVNDHVKECFRYEEV